MEKIENYIYLAEDTDLPNSSNIETTDQNLSVDLMFQQSGIQSLATQICSVVEMIGPTAALFNIVKKDNENSFKILRKEVQCFPSRIIKTGLTREVVQDSFSQFGKETEVIIGNLLRGISNKYENDKLFELLDNECVEYDSITFSQLNNAEMNFFEITQKVHELILKMNIKNQRTYNAFAVIPYIVLAGIMGIKNLTKNNEIEENGLFITEIGKTKYFINPYVDNTNIYVGLKDENDLTKSSLVFGKYQNSISDATDPETGEIHYYLANRFSITSSPLHLPGDEMLYKIKAVI